MGKDALVGDEAQCKSVNTLSGSVVPSWLHCHPSTHAGGPKPNTTNAVPKSSTENASRSFLDMFGMNSTHKLYSEDGRTICRQPGGGHYNFVSYCVYTFRETFVYIIES